MRHIAAFRYRIRLTHSSSDVMQVRHNLPRDSSWVSQQACPIHLPFSICVGLRHSTLSVSSVVRILVISAAWGRLDIATVGTVGHISIRFVISLILAPRMGLVAVSLATGIGWFIAIVYWRGRKMMISGRGSTIAE